MKLSKKTVIIWKKLSTNLLINKIRLVAHLNKAKNPLTGADKNLKTWQ